MLTIGRPTKQQLDEFDPKSVANGQDILYGNFKRTETDVDSDELLDTISFNDFDNLSTGLNSGEIEYLYFLNVSVTVEAIGAGLDSLVLKWGSHDFINNSITIYTFDLPSGGEFKSTFSVGNFSASGQFFVDNGYIISSFSAGNGISIWSDRASFFGDDVYLTISGELLLYKA